MKIYHLVAALIFSLNLSAQNNLMFDTVKIDKNTKLIGRYEHYDKKGTYQHWNFCIDNPAEIKAALKELTIGAEVKNSFEDPSFNISIIQNNKEGKHWIVNPTLKSALYNGHTYKFDIEKVKRLSKKYPFDYKLEKITFSNMEKYRKYLTKQKTNKAFLFDYSPSFRYEGSFEMQFPKTSTFSSPKAISEFLEPLIEKIVRKGDYNVSYILDDKNMNNQNQFTMTITGSKKLFDNLKSDNLKKENWQATIEEGYFFYKTK